MEEDVLRPYRRMVPKGDRYYVHVMSRVVNRAFVLGSEEKEYFVSLMRRLAAFSGLEIVTYAILDNHFHALIYVPEPRDLSDEELLARLKHIYTRQEWGEVRQRLERFKGYGPSDTAYDEERRKHLRRMYDLGEFMKALKQQFTRWYNRRAGRCGTLWEARYKSVVVQGAGHPLLTMATYIDLNSVRAGLCEDPKDYRWCGYAEALAGSKPARAGLKRIALEMERSTDWRMVHRTYRMELYGAGEQTGLAGEGVRLRPGFDREKVVKVWEQGGALRREELLRYRVRYFSDGVAIGSKLYMEEFVERFRDCFGEKRKRAGSRLRT